jgi:glycosyltransferase involved in cell wall biosynthesis
MEVATAKGTGSTAPLDEPMPVSVICTARNAAPTIEATIRSITAQDFQNWEMIIVDDGSTDDTVSIVNRLAASDPRIRLIATPGVGRGRALNLALAAARADLVANIDADDESHPHRLQYQFEAMDRHPEFAIMCTERVIVEGGARPVWPEIGTARAVPVVDVTRALAWGNPVCHSSVLMRKAAVIGLGGYEEARRFVFDYDLWARCAAAGLRLGEIQMPLVAKRIHPGQKYMHTARVRYMCAGLRVHARAMRAVGVGTYYLPALAALRVVRLILPLGLRARLSTLRTTRALRRRHSRSAPDGMR